MTTSASPPVEGETPSAKIKPLRIICIGDSITQGGNLEGEYTYRLPLQTMLRERSVAFDFIGTRQEGLREGFCWPATGGQPFDPDHEGYYGWKTAPVVEKLREHLPDLPPPDVALVHLGTNDQQSEDFEISIGKPLAELIDLLRTRNPNVIVLLGHLNFLDGPAVQIRRVVEAVANTKDSPASPVRTVLHHIGWRADPNTPWSDTFDWVHPNSSGQQKMAAAWLHTLDPFLNALKTSSSFPSIPGPLSPPIFDDAQRVTFGRKVQRFMSLLSNSSANRRLTARILIYGQSISEGAWWRLLVEKLQNRFPHARIIAENRALGGFSSQRLVRTVKTDLQGFEPDLILFHAYGADTEYEQIVRIFRTQTTADILLQTDHIGEGNSWKSENIDPAVITRDEWSAFMNYVHLPNVARRYDCGILPQRDVWKRYLTEHRLDSSVLLIDGIHLNAAGNRLMAEIADCYFITPLSHTLVPDPFNTTTVKTLIMGRELHPKDGVLKISFVGNRIDLLAPPEGLSSDIKLLLDGKAPSANSSCYAFTRATPLPGGKWPALTGIRSESLPVGETWTLHVHRLESEDRFAFRIEGSITGADGEGTSDRSFVSKSQRVAFEPEGWDVNYAMKLAGIDEVPKSFRIVFSSYPLVQDSFHVAPAPEPEVENAVTAVSGIPYGSHTLEISGPVENLRGLRIYSPQQDWPSF